MGAPNREPRQRRAMGRLWQVAAWLAAVAIMSVPLLPIVYLWDREYFSSLMPDLQKIERAIGGLLNSLPEPFRDGEIVLYFASGFAFAAAFVVLSLFQRRAQRHLVPLGEAVLMADARPPILYLRPFSQDQSVEDEEMNLAAITGLIGPVVAIGRPGELLPTLGAHRIYIGDADWQDRVTTLLRQAKVVFLLAGQGSGIAWEVQQCFSLANRQKLLIIVPNSSDAYAEFRSQVEMETGEQLPPFHFERGLGRWAGVVWFTAERAAISEPFYEELPPEYAGYSKTNPALARLWLAMGPGIRASGAAFPMLPPKRAPGAVAQLARWWPTP
jgi:hypothetical protein